jgi:hypothetical protein
MLQRSRKPLLALAVIFMLSVLAVVFLSRDRTAPLPALPNPNGYDDFLKASEVVAGNFRDSRELDRDSLGALVATNSEALRLLRLGLTRQCMMPMDSALTNAGIDHLGGMKRLVQLLAAEGRREEMEDRPAEAARSYVDAIRFGNEMSRGGFLITRLVGIACEAIGYAPLAKVVPKLSRADARIVLTELEKVDAGRVTWAEVLRSEQNYVRFQLRGRMNPIMWVWGWWQSRGSQAKAEAKHKMVIAHERLLVAELGLRCYQSEQGRAPEGLEQLVPKYLQRVPSDPFSRRPLLYRQQGTNWMLYSVGTDGVDDGGKPAGRSVSGNITSGDLFYNSPY